MATAAKRTKWTRTPQPRMPKVTTYKISVPEDPESIGFWDVFKISNPVSEFLFDEQKWLDSLEDK